jgi:hypothetical protein
MLNGFVNPIRAFITGPSEKEPIVLCQPVSEFL